MTIYNIAMANVFAFFLFTLVYVIILLYRHFDFIVNQVFKTNKHAELKERL